MSEARQCCKLAVWSYSNHLMHRFWMWLFVLAKAEDFRYCCLGLERHWFGCWRFAELDVRADATACQPHNPKPALLEVGVSQGLVRYCMHQVLNSSDVRCISMLLHHALTFSYVDCFVQLFGGALIWRLHCSNSSSDGDSGGYKIMICLL